MPEEKVPNSDGQESEGHAQWVREHPRIDDSGFPEYPDEPSRRGSSRGAVANGNPWRPVEADEKPGRPEWDADTWPASFDAEPDEKERVAEVASLPDQPTDEPAVVSASNEADERIGHDIGDMLACSKKLEGTHLLVEVVDGEVFLHGTVADQTVRSEVEQLSSSVRGAKRIHNELDVRH